MNQAAYEALAAFRLEIRRFFAFSKDAIETAGFQPVQYQAMLAVKAHRGPDEMTVSKLAGELFIKVQTAVELSIRMEQAGLLERRKGVKDRRQTILSLTPQAQALMVELASLHLNELQVQVPDFIAILGRIATVADA